MNNKEKIKFSDAIFNNSGFSVLRLTNEIKSEIEPYIKQAIINYNSEPKFDGRVNEFGNYMESVLANTSSEKFSKPTKVDGKKQNAGYPDSKFISSITPEIIVYPEVKVFNKGSELSSFRSFYVSTFTKITSDAMHIVIGFEHSDKILTGKYHIIDMIDKTLSVKVELACSNVELYK